MYYVWLVVMWASGFACGAVVVLGLARAARISADDMGERLVEGNGPAR